MTQDSDAAAKYRDLNLVRLYNAEDSRIRTDEPGLLGSGGNSGFQAVNLAVQFGATKIVLVGFDYRIDLGIHWHGRYPPGLNNPNQTSVARWRERLDSQAKRLADLGVTVLNASEDSALSAFPKVPLMEALK